MNINSLIIITKNRNVLTQRALDSFRENSSSKTLTYIVYDQSEAPPKYRGIDRFCGPAEVAAYVDKLVDAGFPRELIEFGLIGDYGGYRNVAVLDTIGEYVLSTDDDTLCEFVAHPKAKLDCLVYGQPRPNYRRFANRQEWEWLSASWPRTTRVISEHEKYLGKTTQDGYIFRVVVAGLLGDAAASHDHPYLFNPSQREALFENYDVLRSTREVMQVVSSPTGSVGSTFMRTMNYSFDNTNFLPPAPPNGRGQPGVFGEVLSLMRTECVLYLPWAVVHVPPEGRGYLPHNSSLLIEEGYQAAKTGLEEKTISGLGKALYATRTLSVREMSKFLHSFREMANRALVGQITKVLDENKGPDQWVQDCREAIARATEPVMFDTNAVERVQYQLWMYGELLLRWPDIYDTARRLQRTGVRVSK
jgi:hypothetical protein